MLDLLSFIPRSYQDRRKCVPIREIKPGELYLTKGKIMEIRRLGFRYKQIVEMKIVDKGWIISAKWKGAPPYLFKFRKCRFRRLID